MNEETLNLDPTTNPDAQEALSIGLGNSGLWLVPLKSGRLAIFDRSFILKDILDEPPTTDYILGKSQAFKAHLATVAQLAAERRFLGEPDDKTLIRDIKRGENAPKIQRKSIDVVEITL